MDDKVKIIRPTSDIIQLDIMRKEYECQPYEKKLKADEDCIALYGMTNYALYQKLRAALLMETIPDDILNTGNRTIKESNVYSILESEEDESYEMKINQTIELNKNPNIALIYPGVSSIEDLEDKYNKYLLLTDKFKLISNSYSYKLWGYDVPNMYRLQKGILTSDKVELQDSNLVKESKEFMRMTEESVNDMMISGDILGLLRVKLEACDRKIDGSKSGLYEDIVTRINTYINKPEDFKEVIPGVVPCYTSDELDTFPDDVNGGNYYDTIKNYIMDYYNNPCEETKKKLIEYGWNPAIPFNEKGFKYSKERQNEWLKEHCVQIVDVTGLNTIHSISESSTKMRKMYKKEGLYPIIIITSFSNTLFGKVIVAVKHATYSHAGIALDTNLKDILTYKFDSKHNGFHKENIDDYLHNSDKAKISVLALFVDKSTYDKLGKVIKDFFKKQDKTRYNFGNLLNIAFNREKDYTDSLSFVCSQFVDVVLRMVNIKLLNKPNNLVTPQDFADVVANPKVYKLYEGLASKYNEKKVEEKINSLYTLFDTSKIQYHNMTDLMEENFSFESLYYTTENEEANKVLEEMREYIKPECAIMERKFPIQFNKVGDLEISTSKSLEEEYQEAHKLLEGYNKSNIDGIKHELARLFYINSLIEKKIKNMKKNDPEYHNYIKLRSRVLNDFKKYFKVITNKDDKFDFNTYFQSTEYYNGNIVIKSSTLKHSGDAVLKFMKSLKL